MNDTLTRKKLAHRVYEEYEGLLWRRDADGPDARSIVNTVLEKIRKAVVEGDRVELRRFGVFELQHRRANVARNPRTGEAVEIPPRVVPNFRPSKLWKEHVAEVQDPQPEPSHSKEEDAAA